MKLPNPERAIVDINKLRNYCLNPNHRDGQHKARVFASVLEMIADDAEELRDALLVAAQTNDAIPIEQDEYGQRYRLDFVMSRPAGQATIRSGWIVRQKEDFPRLTSCYVLKQTGV
ncbi:DUF6883 domain-containing protein [Argonema antarcticum]|uniref:DUF6883 domain-containing protein n=1 Tax=Argonema antarcticum TaxID=2942763 RepID=UPI002010CAE5|nr:DUF6883 domain-containing protein [Argonema antarcticum]MCL1471579.1 hypothetical protein [Argonema antarcticum A004/B2]